jgi:uncharacterized protein YfaS (alpha-2-macroglobulin family)
LNTFTAALEGFRTAISFLFIDWFNWNPDVFPLGNKTIYKDRIISYADHFQAGIYRFHYLVRSVTPGALLWPGAEVHLQYTPEEFGRSADSTLILEAKN